jgi:hypothetical protein
VTELHRPALPNVCVSKVGGRVPSKENASMPPACRGHGLLSAVPAHDPLLIADEEFDGPVVR